MRRVLPTPADTHAFGVELAALLRPGDLVLLSGPLGAGKTALTQGIGAGLGVPGAVTSPTFVLARVHRGGRVPLVHVDAYRLGSVADDDDLDLDASADEAVTVVEWGHGLVEQLADEHLVVELSRAEDDVRTAELVPHGASWTARLAALPDRPVRRRATVRVLLLDDHDRVLLLRDSDTGTTPVSTWWMTPGGGIEDGEDELTAVVRELAEETGLVVAPGQVQGPIARRRVRHGYSDQVVDQVDAFYVVRVPAFDVSVAGLTEDEQRTLLGHRWWTREELASASEPVWPVLLPELWDLATDPAAWPRELPDVEESTRP
ncbi:MAG: tRNA ((37)-N6)-threonylcarbamoyltransferase complex ATPase subunit type 1 TsaE [Klenkia sp.]|nr:tRNA ((37)-N6)-threonylcarbamoyltransferase complex ATPase subunit type 1 TsaE [Klenkia sp.]